MDDDRYYDDYDEYDEYYDRRAKHRKRRRGRGFLRLLILLLILYLCITHRDRLQDGFVTSAQFVRQILEDWISPAVEEEGDGIAGWLPEEDSSEEETESAVPAESADEPAPETEALSEKESSVQDGGDAFLDGPYYYYRMLSGEDRKIYRTLYQGLMDMKADISFDLTDHEHVYNIEMLMLADHPEIFWYEGAGNFIQYTLSLTLSPQYTMDAEERAVREKKIAEAAEQFKARIGPGEGTYEKLATAFNFVAGGCTYKEGAPDNQNICSSLINHESVCAGYAKGVQYLLQQIDIECLYVWGVIDGRGDHAWNIVNIDGTYYHSDATFGDRSFSDGSAKEHGLPDALAMEYGYLAMSDEDVFRDRKLNPELSAIAALPVCDSTEKSYYQRHGWFYPDSTEDAWSEVKRGLSNKERYFRIRFGTEEAFNDFMSDIDSNRYAKLALDRLGLSKVRTFTSPNEIMRIVVGWIP